MQKNPAIANKTKIDKYNPESLANPIAYLMNKAPAYKLFSLFVSVFAVYVFMLIMVEK